MSGVIDENGQQWEHCNHCGIFTRIQDLVTGYSPKWPDYPWVDLCKSCKSKLEPKTYYIDETPPVPLIYREDVDHG